jgi:hypothetical protein
MMAIVRKHKRKTKKGLCKVSRHKRKYIPPKKARANALRTIKWREKYPEDVKGMTRVGWTRARQLSSGKPISYDIVNRMYKFKRHEKNKSVPKKYRHTPWKDRGRVAWDGWGGDEGIDWATYIVKSS